MRFAVNGKWVFNSNSTVSDKIRNKLACLWSSLKGSKIKDSDESPAKIFGEFVANSEICWEASCELNIEDFMAIQKEARENDDHILEWYKKFGKSLVAGTKVIVNEAKEIVPEVQTILHDLEMQTIEDQHNERVRRSELKKSEEAEK